MLVLPEGALVTPRPLPPRHTPSNSVKKAVPGAAPTVASKEGTHVVQANESLWTISKKYHISFEDIQRLNPGAADKPLRIGQVIIVKAPNGHQAAPAPQVAASPLKKDAEQPKNTVADTPAPAPKPTETAKEPAPIGGLPKTSQQDTGTEDEGVIHYTVRENDTLEVLAQIYGTTVDLIKKQNPSVQSNQDLKPGVKIDIPYKLLKP